MSGNTTFSLLAKIEKLLNEYLDLKHVTKRLIRRGKITKQDEKDILRDCNTKPQRIRSFIRILGLCNNPLPDLIDILMIESESHNANGHKILADVLQNKRTPSANFDSCEEKLGEQELRLDSMEKHLDELSGPKISSLEDKLREREEELAELEKLTEVLYERLNKTDEQNESLQDELKTREKQISELQREVAELKAERERTQGILREHSRDIQQLKEQHKSTVDVESTMMKMCTAMNALAEGMSKIMPSNRVLKAPVNEIQNGPTED